jgi:ribosomal protein S18 acetylase RimI-like enzyme
VEQTSGEAYDASSTGWSRPKKRKEMQLPDMKYLLVRADEPSARIEGFLSFMVTYEDGKEVVYCYEIHLSPTARGRGLGKLLMGRMEEIGRAVGLEKAMLTVFRSNTIARRFYEKLGYETDEYSPQPRRLRNGTIKEADYLILSRTLK